MYDMDIFGIVVDIFINSIVKCMWLYGNLKLFVFLEILILIILCVLLYKENMGKWICCFGLLCCYFFMFIEDNGIFLY